MSSSMEIAHSSLPIQTVVCSICNKNVNGHKVSESVNLIEMLFSCLTCENSDLDSLGSFVQCSTFCSVCVSDLTRWNDLVKQISKLRVEATEIQQKIASNFDSTFTQLLSVSAARDDNYLTDLTLPKNVRILENSLENPKCSTSACSSDKQMHDYESSVAEVGFM